VAAVATHVALQRVREAVAAHVDGVHDVVQEEDPAVFAAVRPHRLAVGRHHREALGRRLRAGPHGVVLAPLLLLHRHAVPGPRGDVVGQVDEAGRRAAGPLLAGALGVRGVAAARRAVLLAGGRLGVGEQQQVLGRAVAARPPVALGRRRVQRVQGAGAHVGRGGRRGLDQGPQRLRPQVADGAVDGLVDDVGLDQLAGPAVVGEVRQALVS